ncbi:transport-related protein [Moniliophthora roreri]|nr:transport-related protein [Moniliophthora roreri]
MAPLICCWSFENTFWILLAGRRMDAIPFVKALYSWRASYTCSTRRDCDMFGGQRDFR